MTSIYDQTTYVMLPRIQAARTLKREIRNAHFCSWCLGKAYAYQNVAEHNRRIGRDKESVFWRSLMRMAARDAVREAKYNLGLIKYTYEGGAR